MSPADAYFGRKFECVPKREKIKQRTMRMRKQQYRAAIAAQAEARNCLIAEAISSPEYSDGLHEFTLEQAREVVIHLAHYAGYARVSSLVGGAKKVLSEPANS